MRLFYNEMKYFLAVIITLIGLQLFSQEVNEHYVVTGIVYDADTHTALQFISLTLQDIETKEIIGDITSKNGEFELNVPKGKYNFIAESLSFRPFKIDLLNIQQDLELGIIELNQKVEELNEIEVIAKNKLVDYQYDKKIYNASKDIANVGGNAVTVLENTPTVRIDEQGRITVRGNTVLVLVDGKPYGGQNSSADILSLIPSNSISKVEVITHSAKYGGQGGEILNIVLKKRKTNGYNGTVEIHGGFPDNDGVSTYLNLKTEKINFFSTASFNHLVQKKDSDINQIFLDENQTPTSSFNEQRFDFQQKNSLLLNLGADFLIDEDNKITTSLLFSDTNMNYDAELSLNDFEPINVPKQTSKRNVDDNTDNGNIEAYIDYTTKFKKEEHELSASLQYDKNIASNETFIHQTEITPNNDFFRQKSNQNQNLHSYSFKVDYKVPLNKNSFFEAGTKINCRTYENDFILHDLNTSTQIYEPLSNTNNDISYNEYIYGLYSSYGKKFKDFSINLSVISERTSTIIGQNSTNVEYKNEYLDFFPTALLNYTFKNNSSIMAKYQYSIDRPSISQLNPFNSFTDERYQRTGNPFLNPSYSNYFLLEYHQDFEKVYLNTAIYYMKTDDAVLNILEKTDDQTIDGFSIYRQIPANNGNLSYACLEVDLTYEPTNKFRFNVFLGPYYRELKDSKENLYDFDNIVWYGTFSAMYRFANTLRFQANYFYQTAKKTALNELGDIQTLNFAASKDLFEGKSTLTFKINDVFHTREAAYKSLEANTISTRNVIFNTQYLLSFSYRFNKVSKRNSNNRTKDVGRNVFEIEETMQ